jgi:hypothetical protein
LTTGEVRKSVLARRLGATKDLPVVELDKEFWLQVPRSSFCATVTQWLSGCAAAQADPK